MAFPILIAAAAVLGGFMLLRILMGGRSSPGSRREAENKSLRAIGRIRAYEQNVEILNKRIKTAQNDRQRELMAKKMELLLKQKEKLKHRTERLVKKS